MGRAKGTTQVDQITIAVHSLTIVLLIRRLRNNTPDVKQVWFADDMKH